MNIGLKSIATCMLVSAAALIATTVGPLAQIPPAGHAQDDYYVAVPQVVRGPFVSHPLVDDWLCPKSRNGRAAIVLDSQRTSTERGLDPRRFLGERQRPGRVIIDQAIFALLKAQAVNWIEVMYLFHRRA